MPAFDASKCSSRNSRSVSLTSRPSTRTRRRGGSISTPCTRTTLRLALLIPLRVVIVNPWTLQLIRLTAPSIRRKNQTGGPRPVLQLGLEAWPRCCSNLLSYQIRIVGGDCLAGFAVSETVQATKRIPENRYWYLCQRGGLA